MAEKSDKKPARRQLKKPETVRERAERVSTAAPKQRRVTRTAGKVTRPLRKIGAAVGRVFRPLAFVLKPFRTKPFRLIGRVIAAILLFKFFRNSWKEVRQVQWPSARETYRLTVAVFIFSLLFGALVAVTDYGLDKVFKKVFID